MTSIDKTAALVLCVLLGLHAYNNPIDQIEHLTNGSALELNFVHFAWQSAMAVNSRRSVSSMLADSATRDRSPRPSASIST